VANTEEARTLGLLIPGAEECYVRATERDNWKAQSRVVPNIQGARVSLGDAKDGGSAIQGGAEVSATSLRASKRVVTFTVHLTCAGQTAQVASQLTHVLRTPVLLRLESDQQLLPFAKAQPVVVHQGGIAVGKDVDGATCWGRIVDIDAEGRCTFDCLDDGHLYVEQDTVTTCWPLLPGEATEKAIMDYRKRCQKAGVKPSFRAITLAVGEAYASQPPSDGLHQLTPEIVQRAVEFAQDTQQPQPDLPPEADAQPAGEPPKTIRRRKKKEADPSAA